jgi:hypothetical protein
MVIREKIELQTEDAFVKVVVDVERGVFAAHCDMHMDCADELIADGSKWADLWGANVFAKERHIQYSSMINIRPKAGNRSMDIADSALRERVRSVIEQWVLW